MHLYCGAIIDFILFGMLTLKAVKSDGSTIVDKGVVSSSDVLTAETQSWHSNIEYKSPNLATLRDISKALNVVTNDSIQINQLIPQLFNLSLADPAYVFRLPQGGDAKLSYLILKKSDFVQPIFPKLTASYVRLMSGQWSVTKVRNRDEKRLEPITDAEDWWNHLIPNSMEEDDPTLFLNLQTERNFIEYVSGLNKQDEDLHSKSKDNDEWNLLGLHGWMGALSKPSKDNRPLLISNDKPQSEKSDQKWDLPGRMQKDSIESSLMENMNNTSILKMMRNFSQAMYSITNMHEVHLDGDVYIGRVNDAFGHSTKWSLKNLSSQTQQDRKKRAVIELYSMIKCSTGCDPIVYRGYGCYCGFLGDGKAVDGIDQCCKLHDKCYESSNCISYLEYFVPYIWKCYRGKPLCAIDHGEWGGPISCASRLCKCDLILSRCLRRYVCPLHRALCRSSKARLLQNLFFNF